MHLFAFLLAAAASTSAEKSAACEVLYPQDQTKQQACLKDAISHEAVAKSEKLVNLCIKFAVAARDEGLTLVSASFKDGEAELKCSGLQEYPAEKAANAG